jgi:hypothetical protein
MHITRWHARSSISGHHIFKWWSMISVPFHSVGVLISIDSGASLALLVNAVANMWRSLDEPRIGSYSLSRIDSAGSRQLNQDEVGFPMSISTRAGPPSPR